MLGIFYATSETFRWETAVTSELSKVCDYQRHTYSLSIQNVCGTSQWTLLCPIFMENISKQKAFQLNKTKRLKRGPYTKTKLNSVALVRKRTIPTERPPLSAK
jgi:hypothetical protein